MFADATTYCKTCEVCQKNKINYTRQYSPVHPHPVLNELCSRLARDHEVLTRTTAEGNIAVLVVVEAFSGYPHLIPVKDMTSLTTAKALVQQVITFCESEDVRSCRIKAQPLLAHSSSIVMSF